MIRYKNIRYYTDIDEFDKDYYIKGDKWIGDKWIIDNLKTNGFLVIFDEGVWCSCSDDKDCHYKDYQTCKIMRETILREKKLERIINEENI